MPKQDTNVNTTNRSQDLPRRMPVLLLIQSSACCAMSLECCVDVWSNSESMRPSFWEARRSMLSYKAFSQTRL